MHEWFAYNTYVHTYSAALAISRAVPQWLTLPATILIVQSPLTRSCPGHAQCFNVRMHAFSRFQFNVQHGTGASRRCTKRGPLTRMRRNGTIVVSDFCMVLMLFCVVCPVCATYNPKEGNNET